MKEFKYITLCCCMLACSSCIDTELEQVVDHKDHYQTIPDADNAIIGLYGQFMKLAEQTIVLNELRGDLLDVTVNSSTDLQEINTNTPSSGNKYVDQSNYYSVIQNCNDIMEGFDTMLASNKMTKDEYAERYSDVAALRCWTYLQLGIQFGKVAYVTDPVVTVDQAKQLETLPKIGLDELLPRLITCMEQLPSLEEYQNSSLVKYNLDGYSLQYFFVNKRILLGDLYLWNNDYMQAAVTYRKVLSATEDADAVGNSLKYRCAINPITSSADPTSFFMIGYERWHEQDINSYHNTWKNLFSLPMTDRYMPNEMIWTISYDKAYKPYFPLIDLFANTGHGEYQLKPSIHAVKNLWEAQEQSNGFRYDARGRDGSFSVVNGEYVVQKYLNDYDASKPYEKSGRWFLYRASTVMLRFAEAANRCGKPLLAYALLNQGIGSTFAWGDDYQDYKVHNAVSGWGPGQPYPAPFYFDARYVDAPTFRGPWRNFGGVRGRVYLKSKEFPANCVTTGDSIRYMEKELIEEAALDYGFEGHRWEDLIRVSRRMNKEGRDGSAYLKGILEPKYSLSGEAMPDYSIESKWYLNITK